MKQIYLITLSICYCLSNARGQEVVYSPLYDNSIFNRNIAANAIVGSTPAEGSVSPSGAAVYTIPLSLPPGTNGVMPNIAIEYNSLGRNGILGVNWGISGLSAINRVTANLHYDNAIRPVELNANDRFALNEQRLILKSGTYGLDNSTYGPEMQDFSTVKAKGAQGAGPLYFEVITKDGVLLEYGKTADARFMDVTNTQVLSWRLNKVTNPDGNYMEYKYVNTDRDPRIDEINFTGNAAAGLLPYNKIKFAYKIRADVNVTYESGSSITSKYLLDKITITTESAAIVKSYQFNYAHDFINSYLKEVIETGQDGISSLNATVFKYGDLPAPFTKEPGPVLPNAQVDFLSSDFDGNGKSDLVLAHYTPYTLNTPWGLVTDKKYTAFNVYRDGDKNKATGLINLDPGTQIKTNAYQSGGYSFLRADFTGDGLDDMLTAAVSTVGNREIIGNIKIYKSQLSPGGQLSDALQFTATTITRNTYLHIPETRNYILNGDFDGDGKQDLFTLLEKLNPDNSSAGYEAVLTKLDGNLNPANLKMVRETDNSNVASTWATARKIFVIDFDGDGKDDVMTIAGNLCEVHTCTNLAGGNSYFKTIFSSSTLLKSSDRMILPGDYNGDGKTDLLYQQYADGLQNSLPWFKAISTGTSFEKVPFAIVSSNGVIVDKDILHAADFNGDGRTDLYHQYKHAANNPPKSDVYYSTNNASFVRSFNPGTDATYGITTVPFDLNGDGRTEIVIREANSTNLSIISLKKGGREHLLEKVENGVGLVTSWQYKSMVEGGPFYNKGAVSALNYPFHSIQLPMYLVHTFDNKDDGFSGSSFTYENARLHRRGKGWIGFGKTNVFNFITGYNTTSENEFDTNHFVAIPKQTTVSYDFDAPSVLVSKTVLNNEIVNLPSKQFWFKTSTIHETLLGGLVITTNNIFDAFGNITQSTLNKNGIETTVTNANYEPYPGIVPNKPTSITTTVTRSGQPAFPATTALDYYPNGQLKSKTDFNNLAKKVKTEHTYFPLGNLKSTTVTPFGPDVSGPRSSSFLYDSKGRYAQTSTDFKGQATSATYDPKWGVPITETDQRGLVTTFQYDVFGRNKKTILPEGYQIEQQYQWNVSGNSVWNTNIIHPGRPDVKTYYDKLGREVQTETEGFGGQTVTQIQTYDLRGNIATATEPYKAGEPIVTETRKYDAFNRIEEIASSISPIGKINLAYAYSAGNLVTTKTRKGILVNQISSMTKDATGKVVGVTDDGGTLTYSYFSHGGLKDVKQASKTLIVNEYDIYGRQTKLTDLNAGVTSYVYNALGELAKQTNATGGVSTMQYDVAGRIKTRIAPEGTTSYEYYPANAGSSSNQTKKITGFAGNLEEYTYDNFGRLQTMNETVDAAAHMTTFGYNMYGDVTSAMYPSGFGTNNAYDTNGFPTTIKNTANNITIVANTGINGQGQVTNYTLGNGLSSVNSFVFGFPTKMLTAGKQNLNLDWEYGLGLLKSRNDAVKGKTESFLYDEMDRLKQTTIGAANQVISYHPNGNINTKTDAGTFSYHATMINAVTGVTNPAPSPVPLMQQDITYTSFLQPEKITETNEADVPFELTYTYGSDYERIKSVLKQNGAVTNTRYYFGDYEKNVAGASTKHVHYVKGASGLAAIVVREGGADTYYYAYSDHLGSINTLTNAAGTVIAEQSFDAWRRRRNPATWAVLPPTAATALPTWLYRGYTGHEHLDNFGLINMNGRMYDPVVARMLSPDNIVPDASSTQGFNRYSYAMNNPLSYTDPDGQNPLLAGMSLAQYIGLGVGAISGGLSAYKIAKNNGASSGVAVASAFGGAILGGALGYGLGSIDYGTLFGRLAGSTSSASSFGALSPILDPGRMYASSKASLLVNNIANVGINQFLQEQQLKDMTKKFNQQLRVTNRFFSSMNKTFNNMPINEVQRAGLKMSFFYEQVKTNGPFDLKNNSYSVRSLEAQFAKYGDEIFKPQDFGNLNFGVAAKAFGLPLQFSQQGAGAYQIWSQTSQWSWYETFFDDPVDFNMISRGYKLKFK